MIRFKNASFREADFSFPIHFVCPAAMRLTGTLREVLVCSRDQFTVDPAQWGFGAPRASKPFCSA
jgi:hypothetical protein